MAKFRIRVYKWPPVRYIIQKARQIILPAVGGASLYDVSKFFFKELRTLKLTERAAGVTYNFLMAMPPVFLFLFSLIPYMPLQHVQQTILSILRLITPNDHIYDTVSKVLIDFMNTPKPDVLSFGVLLILFFSSNGMMGLMRSFDKSQSLYVKRTGLSRRWTAVKLTFMLIAVSLLAISVLIIQSQQLNVWVLRIFHNVIAIKVLSIFILIVIIFFAISIIYKYGPSLSHRSPLISVGSLFATSMILIVSSVFFFLVNHFLNYNKVYGSIGTLIAFMVWLWLNVVIILLGYELNVSILLGRLSQEEDEEDIAV